MTDNPNLYDENAAIGLKLRGNMGRVLFNSALTSSSGQVEKIDDAFRSSEGSLAKYSKQSGVDPMAAARTLVDVGLMDNKDPRFAAAFEVSLEARDHSFVRKTLDPESMQMSARDFASRLQEEGARREFVGMRAIELRLRDGENVTPTAMAAAVEKNALGSGVSDELRKTMLKSSVRCSIAEQMDEVARSKQRADRATDQR